MALKFCRIFFLSDILVHGLPSWLSGKESTCHCRRCKSLGGSIPGSGRSRGEGNGNPLQYSCLGNPMDGGAWRATAHGVTRVTHDLGTRPAHHHPRTCVKPYKVFQLVLLCYVAQECKQPQGPVGVLAR